MRNVPSLGIVFVAMAVIFVVVAFLDYLKAEDKLSPARKAWLLLALIFAAVVIGLHFVQAFLG